MNREIALATRRELRLIISRYEQFLRGEILQGNNSVVAVEAMGTRDIIRTVAMSEVNKGRVDRILGTSGQPQERNLQADRVVSSQETALVEELSTIGSAAQPGVVGSDNQSSSERLFRDLEECIPCSKYYGMGDFDWSRLKDILKLDLAARFQWITQFERMLGQNEIAWKLCQIMQLFKNMCPQDLLRVIALLVAWLTKTLDSIEINLDGLLKDILGAILRPYIIGLEDFLNIYLQLMVDQLDCIINLIVVSAQELRDLKVSNTLGPDKIQFEKDVITGRGDKFLDKTAQLGKRASKLINEDREDVIRNISNDLPAGIVGLLEDSVEWLETQAIKIQDFLIDILGGEWLVTGRNMSLYEQMKAVTTLIHILQVIHTLAKGEDLCNEDNIRDVIVEINDRLPDVVVIAEEVDTVPSIEGRTRPEFGDESGNPEDRQNSAAPPSLAVQTIPFSLSSCLQKPDDVSAEQIDRWIRGLG